EELGVHDRPRVGELESAERSGRPGRIGRGDGDVVHRYRCLQPPADPVLVADVQDLGGQPVPRGAQVGGGRGEPLRGPAGDGGIGRRQTPGLRRAELAALAGVSVDYYVRLEQGRDTNPGTGVLDALATALRLDDDERAHLHRLARGGLPHPRNDLPHPRGGSVAGTVRPGLLRLLDLVRPAPAYILDPLSTILGYNAEGAGLMAGLVGWPVARRNLIRYVFTHPEARDVLLSWPEITADCVADLRTVAGADPASPHLATLVADLCADSAEFARLWRH